MLVECVVLADTVIVSQNQVRHFPVLTELTVSSRGQGS